jgi:hypothetical protein
MRSDEPEDARRLGMFPLESVLFPGAILPLHVFEPRYRQMMADCVSGDAMFGVVLISRGSEVGGGDQRVGVGTEARIEEASRLTDGRWAVVARGVRRIVVESWLSEDPYPLATVRALPSASVGAAQGVVDEAGAAVRRARALLSELGQGPTLPEPPEMTSAHDPEAPVWHLCSSAPLGAMDRLRLLEIDAPAERIAVLTELALQVTEDLHRLLAQGPS